MNIQSRANLRLTAPLCGRCSVPEGRGGLPCRIMLTEVTINWKNDVLTAQLETIIVRVIVFIPQIRGNCKHLFQKNFQKSGRYCYPPPKQGPDVRFSGFYRLLRAVGRGPAICSPGCVMVTGPVCPACGLRPFVRASFFLFCRRLSCKHGNFPALLYRSIILYIFSRFFAPSIVQTANLVFLPPENASAVGICRRAHCSSRLDML